MDTGETSSRGPRGSRRSPRSMVRQTQDRTRIAQAAARLIAEHGMSDWTAAKQKAARAMGLPPDAAMPSSEDIERALLEYHALFRGDAHAASLRAQRTEALRWLRRLERWSPLLIGGVAAGWATDHSDIRLELVADDPKAVEMALAGEGLSYVALPLRADRDPQTAELRLDKPGSGIRLSIVPPHRRRSRARHDPEPRLDAAALATLLSGESA